MNGKFSNLSAQARILKMPNLIWLNLALRAGLCGAIARHVFKFTMKPNLARDLKLNLIKSDRKI